MSNKERGFYNTRISQLEERLAVVMQQLDTALGAEEEFSLNNRAEQISRQIDEFYAKLDKLDLAHSSQDNSSTEIVETPAPESYPISQIAKENTALPGSG